MKIIARVNREKLLVEMTEDELAMLMGHRWANSIPAVCSVRFNAGTTYPVSDIYTRLHEQAQASQKLDNVSKTLSALADLVTQTRAQFIAATEEPAKEGGGK